MMRITVLAVPDCPNAPSARQRIIEALGGRDADIDLVEVAAPEQAERLGMTGSPTVLVDGTDPLHPEPSRACPAACTATRPAPPTGLPAPAYSAMP